MKLPDVGEGIAEAELTEWAVNVGDVVAEDDTLGAVMTDKANVEIPAPVAGTITWLGAAVGDVVAVGSDIVRIAVDGDASSLPQATISQQAPASNPPTQATATALQPPQSAPFRATLPSNVPAHEPGKGNAKVLASPAVRARARRHGIDLMDVRPSGACGQIRQADVTAYLNRPNDAKAAQSGGQPVHVKKLDGAQTQKMVGLRRKISEKMVLSAQSIPHIAYVEEVDMTALDALRKTLNETKSADQPKLTLIPFLMAAIVKAVQQVPQVNAHFNAALGEIYRYDAVHIGVATQTPNGLVVPVVHDAHKLDIWYAAAAVAQLADEARNSKLKPSALTGSTITISSLGAMGGIVTTPIINHPEVAIVGVNKMQVLPRWDGHQFQPRSVMNLSSSFDHRIIDGWDAAVFVQAIKHYLEMPALLFVP
ncbi:MAG: dihydrolipoamide acetyltransferase family protein [Pseudomonadota bacterium]